MDAKLDKDSHGVLISRSQKASASRLDSELSARELGSTEL